MGLGSTFKSTIDNVTSGKGLYGIGPGNLFETPDAPASPDFVGAAEATAAGNLANAQAATGANRVGQFNPYGSLQWTQNPDGSWSQNVAFSPDQQNLYNLTNQGKADLLSQGTPDFGQNRQKVMDAMLGRVNTDIERARDSKRSELIAQGIPVGSDAYQKEMEMIDRRQNDAIQQAEVAATNQAATEYNAQISGNAQRAGILGGFSPMSPQFHSFYNQQATPGADYMGAAQNQAQFDLGKYNADMGQRNAMMQGLFTLGGAAMMSDRRLKRNIERIGTNLKGLPVYTFNYLWDSIRHVGVMADEVEKAIPGAVIERNGYKLVNYEMV